MRYFLSIMLLLITSAATASDVIFPYRANYTVQLAGLKVGTMKQSLHYDGSDRYVLETTMYTTGVVSWFKSDTVYERSVWTSREGNYQPVEYRYHFDGRGKKVREWVNFDWENNSYDAFFDNKKISMSLPDGVYDKLLYQMILRSDLAEGKKKFSYQVVNKDEIDTLDMSVIGSEEITTPFGKFDTVKIKKGTTTIWCAPDLGYLPVQLEKDEGSAKATSHILSLERR